MRLSKFGFDFHDMVAPDLLHEFELGVWKRTFTHLLRILVAAGDGPIQMLNERCVHRIDHPYTIQIIYGIFLDIA